MITFMNVSQATFNQLQFVVQGDGESTILKVNLAKPPFQMNFNGNAPGGFTVDLGDPDLGVAEATIATVNLEDILTLTFAQAPSATETVGVSLSPFYNSLT